MEQSLLEVKNLTASFRIRKEWVKAIEQVDFKVGKGEIFGIVGESGCGKSVTALSILKLHSSKTFRIDSGDVVFDGKTISSYSTKQMCTTRGKEISMVFQDPMTTLNPSMTIGKQLIEAIIVHGKVDKEEAEATCIHLLEKVGIPSPEKRMREYPHQLSGGMRQRIVIAIAFILNPPLIIADEPTTALDVTTQAQILDLLRDHRNDTDASIILITHDMGVVAEMTDRVMVMYAGMVMEESGTRELFSHPYHPYTEGLLGAIPRKDMDMDELYTIGGTVPTLRNMPKGCRFSTRCRYAEGKCFDAPPPLIEVDCRRVACYRYL